MITIVLQKKNWIYFSCALCVSLARSAVRFLTAIQSPKHYLKDYSMRVAVLVLMSVVVLSSCGIDNTQQNVSPDSFSVWVNVHPPTSLRTEQTWNDWMTPVQTVFQATFESTVEEGQPYEAFIGRTLEGDFRIVVNATLADTTWTVGPNGLEIHAPIQGETHALEVTLEDGVGGRFVPGYSNIPNARVSLTANVNGFDQEIELQPVQGPHGFRYEANASIPLGIYDLKLHVTPPNLYRNTATRDRWTENIDATLPGYDFSFGSGEASVEAEGMRITVRAGAPRVYGVSYGSFGIGLLPLDLRGDETVNFSVRLEDMASLAEGVGQRITHSRVEVTVMGTDPGISVSKILYPTYGAQGFYYTANFALPAE